MVHEEHIENLNELVLDLVHEGNISDAVSLVVTRHPADQADLIEHLDEGARESLVRLLSPDQLADVLEYLDEETRSDLLEHFPASFLAPVLDRVDEDVAADIVQDLPREQAEEVVSLLGERKAVEELLTYPEQSAGGRMSPDVVALNRTWTVDESIQFLRRKRPDERQPFYLYAVEEDGRGLGVVSLRNILTAPPETRIGEITQEDAISVQATDDQEVAAERMRHYNLLALPVIDEEGRLCGVISADDILDVQVEEATEDMFRMAGVGVKEHAFSPVLESAARRVPWLGFNMLWAFAGAFIISLFQGTLERVAVLAVFMPMIAGQCGNSGIQTATIVVRSMALGEVSDRSAYRLLRKELTLSLIKGVLFGAILGVVAWAWKGHAFLGLIGGAAMLLNMLVAGTTGVILPLTMRRLGFDPATIAGVFDTMLTDLMGFLIYLGLATLFISHLT
jgi:magnesium transporter